jgi:hypothetical protein
MSNNSKLYIRFANAVQAKFQEERYGITPCCEPKSLEELEMKRDLCEWKALQGSEDLNDTQIRYFANLPIYVDEKSGTSSNNSHYRYAGSASNRNATVKYSTGFNGEQNVVEINAGGAVTRINLNPVINIDNTELDKYTHYQEVPSSVWTVVHNMEFVPGNELITDLDGNEIEGVTRVIDLNTIEITFSEPIAGYAYVS